MFIPLESITASAFQESEPGSRLRKVERSLPLYLTPCRPTTYTIELIAACNHNCIGCGNVFSRQLKFMSGETWINLLNQLRTDMVSLRITGGECTLHPAFKDIIREIDCLAIPFVVFTNGCWGKSNELVQLFADCKNLDSLLISLHGYDPASYRAFVVTDSFDLVTHNIQRATEAGIRVGTNTILLSSNVNHIKEIAQLSFSLGTASAAFSRYYGKPIPHLELTKAQLREAMANIATLQKKEPRIVFNNCVPMCFTDANIPTKGCTSGFTHCTIDPVGNVRPCTHSPFVLGNLFKQNITEIWDSEPLWQWRNLTPAACTGCSIFDQCRGGCRATAYHQGLTQDPLIYSPFERQLVTPTEILRLYRKACPVPNYTLRQENFGFYLINRNRHIAVSAKVMPILKMLDGQTTLDEIRASLGQTAVNFVGILLLNDLVRLS